MATLMYSLPPVSDLAPRRSLFERAIAFVSEPASPRPLAVLRVGLAGVLLLQALALASHLQELYGREGLIQWSVTEAMVAPGVPSVQGVAEALARIGLAESATVRLVFGVYVGGLACLLLGWRTRAAAAAAWLTHMMLSESGPLVQYGVDAFARIALFYCIWMPVGHDLSLDRQAGRASGEPSTYARIGLRLLQLHLCVAYLAAGLSKAMGEQWWNGEAIWRATMRPDMAQLDMRWLAQAPWLACLLSWGTLLVEVGYAVFVWPRRTRFVWAAGTIGLHLGIAVSMGLWSFSALMSVLTLSAFLIPAEAKRGGSSFSPARAASPC